MLLTEDQDEFLARVIVNVAFIFGSSKHGKALNSHDKKIYVCLFVWNKSFNTFWRPEPPSEILKSAIKNSN